MKILVCITKTPDTTTKIQFTENNTKLNDAGIQWILNPYDEWYALVRALELKETGLADAVHLITVGGADAEPVMRKALAIGGDEAIRVDSNSHDSYNIALQIAEYAKSEQYGLILCGKESIDYNNASVGGMIAELLENEYLANVSKLDMENGQVRVEREIQGGTETDLSVLPCVISCQKGMAEQRIPNMRGIMAARTKPLKVIPSFGDIALTSVVSYELPADKGGIKMIDQDNLDELVKLLNEEAKVI